LASNNSNNSNSKSSSKNSNSNSNSKRKNGRKQHSDEIKETARARVAAGESLSRVAKELGVAKSTLSGWLTQGDRDGHQEVRANRKEQFINKAWDAIEQYLDHLSSPEVMKKAQAQNATTVIGTLYDKIALASGDATSRSEHTGKDGGPIEIDNPREQIERRIAGIAARSGADEDNSRAEH